MTPRHRPLAAWLAAFVAGGGCVEFAAFNDGEAADGPVADPGDGGDAADDCFAGDCTGVAEARAATPGVRLEPPIPIRGATVTYVRHDEAPGRRGVFIQAGPLGPAIVLRPGDAVPTSRFAPGDGVDVDVRRIGSYFDAAQIDVWEGLQIEPGDGAAVDALVQRLGPGDTLTEGLESELVEVVDVVVVEETTPGLAWLVSWDGGATPEVFYADHDVAPLICVGARFDFRGTVTQFMDVHELQALDPSDLRDVDPSACEPRP